ncbi:MAG: hypothetical protein A2Y28_01545 [Chlamydiae bacterium GWC2_50_10]|nr:MAG: hypothetical protein A2Z85_03645 [Chlamydiae bacterium GWA2_50_15]OGN54126.1 MAG: hypothetical protein A2Y28_01545 [Chlamydiae bacterium GWC2_50_10]OGN54684.1 MAG: hypothetical protein A2098_00705 [Chlamydiae bacterium GWF2_49_8]OGN57358.1 MAG: hypothetical protein A3D18_01860 [Chlamydiae bacterium RIFCSPHIGHO2_02_FULL_49_29]OGN64264.1 MAG: hypothetical protein A3E26_03900 [Chlamydiae bacterium RIFCSPHIGHO2_12_FULL_49_32]OGN70672.1 MAG: hypothetical protein A3I15_05715 [Chlamydiae bact
MFQRAGLYGKVIFSLAFLFAIAQFVIVRKEDVAAYRKMLEEYRTPSPGRSLPNTVQQIRTQIHKEIWFTQEDRSRLHYRIFGDSSLLTLEPGGKRMHVVENLNGVKCWMQEKLYYSADPQSKPMQQLRFWEADHGVYRYTTQQLLAQDVHISLFRLLGHTLPVTCDPRIAFLKGIANNVSFSITGKTPQFKAHQFQATLTKASDL